MPGIGGGAGGGGTGAGGIGGGGSVGIAPPAPPSPSEVEWATQGAGEDVSGLDPEERVRALQAQAASLREAVAQLRAALDASERRRQIERELADSRAVDLETATLLTEAAIAGMPEPDVGAAVRELRKRKPFLFQGAGSPRGSAMSGAARGDDAGLARAAEAARASGDRTALLRYLKMRRGE